MSTKPSSEETPDLRGPPVTVHGRLLRNPSNAELAAAIGLSAPSERQASYGSPPPSARAGWPSGSLPLLFEGISVALARTFKLIDAERNAVQTEEWERTFALFRLLI